MMDNPDTSPSPGPRPLNGGRQRKRFALVAVLIAVPVGIALLSIAARQAREAANRTQCKSYLKQIGLALHNYHDVYGSFPPAYTVDADGNALHSWRTLILPYANELALYNQIDLTKPWNDPANAKVFQQTPSLYHCPSSGQLEGRTTYLAIVAPHSAFPGDKSRKMQEIRDGTSNTVAIIEVTPDEAVPWMSPVDATEQQFLEIGPNSKVAHSGGIHLLFCDGFARFLSGNASSQIRRRLVTVDGGETVCGDF